MTTIHTVGHSTRAADEFTALLHAHGIRVLVDVRRFPGSKRHPQFSRQALAATLPAAGIEYVHEEALGGRRDVQDGSPNAAWRNRSFRGYADHMLTQEFRAALDRLIERAAVASTAIMCAEAVPWRCHRNLIADALVARGHEVLHIVSATRADAHELNANARVERDGTITYPGEPAAGAAAQLGLLD
jgi:uncharacterized protein (DUF488 family)